MTGEQDRLAEIRAASDLGSALWDDPIGDARWLIAEVERLTAENAELTRACNRDAQLAEMQKLLDAHASVAESLRVARETIAQLRRQQYPEFRRPDLGEECPL